jgi:hypothetical protein
MPKTKASGLSRRLSVRMVCVESSQTFSKVISSPHEEQATKQARSMGSMTREYSDRTE